MTLARSLVLVAVALVAALAIYLLAFKDSGYEYTLIFENAGQLVVGDNVQIGGRAVGTVDEIELTSNNQAAIRVSVQEPYAPLRENTQAVIRLTSLSGIANRYVAISPGPDARRTLPEHATLTTASTTTAVDLDQLFNTLDPETRADLQGVIKGFQTQLDGKGEQAAEAAEYFNPLLSSARRLVNETDRGRGRADALHRQLVAHGHGDRRAPRRPGRPGRQRQRHHRARSRPRTARSARRSRCCRRRCGAATRRS